MSQIVVVDTDLKPDKGINGEESLRALEAQHGSLPETVMQMTGGGGYQRFYRHPGGVIKTSASLLGVGVDIRGDGGYVLVPPSVHPHISRQYAWELSHHPEETALVDLPSAWVTLLQSPSNGKRTYSEEGNPIREGQRNDTLFRLACSLRAKSMSEAAILAALLAENATRCQSPWTRQRCGALRRAPAAMRRGRTQAQRGAKHHRTKSGNLTLREREC